MVALLVRWRGWQFTTRHVSGGLPLSVWHYFCRYLDQNYQHTLLQENGERAMKPTSHKGETSTGIPAKKKPIHRLYFNSVLLLIADLGMPFTKFLKRSPRIGEILILSQTADLLGDHLQSLCQKP